MTAPSDIVCVEWTLPVDAVWAMRHPSPMRAGEYTTYVVEHEGEPIYVGNTGHTIQFRLEIHWRQRSPVGLLMRQYRDGGGPQIYWTAGRMMFELQVQKALKPRFNKLSWHLRNVPALPHREAA